MNTIHDALNTMEARQSDITYMLLFYMHGGEAELTAEHLPGMLTTSLMDAANSIGQPNADSQQSHTTTSIPSWQIPRLIFNFAVRSSCLLQVCCLGSQTVSGSTTVCIRL